MKKSTSTKSIADATKRTLTTYAKGKGHDRLTASLVGIASGLKATKQECIDSHYFLALKMWKEQAFGEHKTIGDYAFSLGLKEEAQVKQFRNQIAYRAKKGASYLGLTTKNTKKDAPSEFEKIQNAINLHGENLTNDQAESLMQLIADKKGLCLRVETSVEAMAGEVLMKAA